MELEFQLTKEDYREFSKYTNLRIYRANKYLVWSRYGLYLVLFILLLYFDDQRYQYGIVGVGLGFIFYLFYNHIWFHKYKLEKWSLLVPQIISLSTNIKIKTPTENSVIEWAHYYNFVETENLFLLFIETHMANIFPKRAFKDEAQMEEFRKLCREKIPASA